MKQLTKLSQPRVLAQNGPEWTRQYVEAPADTRRHYERWRHADIKARLRDETDSKCAYCEGFVEDVAYPHVEHIIPKSHSPELAHEWQNLTSACERCNTRKGNYYEPAMQLLNPYNDDVSVHLRPQGPLMDWTRGDTRAELTVHKLGLNRIDLVASRAKRLQQVRELIERWHLSDAPLKSVLADVIKEDANSGEFSETVGALLITHGLLAE
ncbi:HNH endonuclease [Clavibacter phaseoli]|uniref:HNH endonuclease n=1 Tax=Clavibacter phaseoli TaxID=1734031 RepID=UPI000E665C2F|nr:hypothetical protein DZF99_00550 [Clavibacter phaseoli]UKF32109.1 hypothetical protein FGD69_14150 [Clavibacter phaseoli]UKF38031.1 hypothetical protein FGI33_13530 [Clavibacter phaseoli]